jgi:hypothetical protein
MTLEIFAAALPNGIEPVTPYISESVFAIQILSAQNGVAVDQDMYVTAYMPAWKSL